MTVLSSWLLSRSWTAMDPSLSWPIWCRVVNASVRVQHVHATILLTQTKKSPAHCRQSLTHPALRAARVGSATESRHVATVNTSRSSARTTLAMARRKSWTAITNTSLSLSIWWILVLWGSTIIRCSEHHSAAQVTLPLRTAKLWMVFSSNLAAVHHRKRTNPNDLPNAKVILPFFPHTRWHPENSNAVVGLSLSPNKQLSWKRLSVCTVWNQHVPSFFVRHFAQGVNTLTSNHSLGSVAFRHVYVVVSCLYW
jgi:hypothetical protein